MGGTPLSILGALLTGEISHWASRLRRKALYFAIAAFFALSAWAVLLAAGVAALAENYGTPIAALAVGIGLIVAAGIAIAVLRFIEWRQRRRARSQNSQTAMLATAAAMALPTVARSRPVLTLVLIGGGLLLSGRLLGQSGDRT